MQLIFQQNSSVTLRMLIFVALSVTLMIFDHGGALPNFRYHVTSSVIYPVQFTVNLPFRMFEWSSENLVAHRTLLMRNDELAQENFTLQTQLQTLEGLEKENERLRQLLQSSREVARNPLVAELLTIDQDPYKQQILLNKGKFHRVYNGQPVIDAKGVVGQVVHISLYASTAILISDISHALPVQINRTGLRTLAQGTGDPNELDLRYLPTTADIKVGDLIVTSGLGGRFPPNYPVARITRVKISSSKAFAIVKAAPTARLDKNREVLLIWPARTPKS